MGLATVLIVILGVGLGLQRFETERPLGRLRHEVQRLARGELHKLDDATHPGMFGGIARDVNAAMERFTLAAPHRSETARKDVGAILGPAPTGPPPQFPPPPERRAEPGPASVFDLPQSHFDPLGGGGGGFGNLHRPATPPPVFMAPPGLQEAAAPAMMMPPPTPERSPPRGYGGPPTLSVGPELGATPDRRLMSPQLGAGPSVLGTAGATPTTAGSGGRGPDRDLRQRLRSEQRIVRAAATAVGGDARGQALTAVVSPTLTELDAFQDPSVAPPTNGGPVDPQEERAYATHVREVFEAYVATRRRCGETVATLTLDKFQARLEINRQQLVTKYGCRSARFSVYVKEGKAAVKASPLR